jgi:hypothetical protein
VPPSAFYLEGNMMHPVSVLLSQPVSVFLPPKPWTSPEMIISYASIGLSLVSVGFGVFIAVMQFKVQKSMRDIQGQKLSFDLFERRMNIYLIVRDSMDAVFQNDLRQDQVNKFYTAFNDSHFLFGEELVGYLREIGDKLVHFNTLSILLREHESSGIDDPALFHQMAKDKNEELKWFMNQHVAKSGSSITPIVENFKKYLDFSKFKS